MWGDHGFLNHLGAIDIGGSGPVHLGCILMNVFINFIHNWLYINSIQLGVFQVST